MSSVTDEPRFVFAPRRSATDTEVGAAHIAWLYRARQLARSVEAKPFQPARLEQTLQQLRPLLAIDVDVARVPKVLAQGGIRFVIVKQLAGTRIDGATFWDEGRPVVVLSMRYPRIDWFWHTLMHELGHVQQGDSAENAVRLDLEPDERDHAAAAEREPAEVEADEFAASYLVDDAALASLLGPPHKPLSAASVQAFAHSVGLHPGIVVGRLHFRQTLPYSQLRRFLVDVRRHIVGAATSDGWNTTDSRS
jgi:HTH-type transcriptional regulator/antitoxin HigA